MKRRSGDTLPQPSGYTAFFPTPLPPTPPIEIGEELQEKVRQTEQALAQLNGIGYLLPNPELFITMAIRKEALLSSQIEGTQATMTDVLTYETWEEVSNFDDVEEVVNYIRALNRAIQMLDELPLCIRIIKEGHAILLQGERGKDKLPGEFRRSQNWIGPSLKHAVFVPPPHEEAALAMSALEKFINKNDTLPIPIKAALIHYQFETIHPFLDGNGRMGRLLTDLFLHWKGVIEKPLLYVSLYLKHHRQTYFDSLMKVRLDGSYEEWVAFYLDAIHWSAMHAVRKIKQVLSLQSDLRERVMNEKNASIRTLKLLDSLYMTPLVSVNKAKELLNISYQGASEQVAHLERLGILMELTGQKRRKRYAFAPYLRLVEE